LAARILYRARGAVTLVGGGPVAPDDLARALAIAPEAIAADGGGDHPLPAGHAFRAVIGDMDSLRSAARLAAEGVALHTVGEQESTDLEKCLYSVEAPLFLGLGFLGGSTDHQLAAMNALAKNPGKPVVLLGGGDLCFLCPREFEIDLEPGTRVSLFPMAPVSGIAWEGLRWPLSGTFRPDGRTGTSNRATGGRLRMAFDAPRMLAILPSALLGPVVDRLRGAPREVSPPA